jgi:hypothetical protein
VAILGTVFKRPLPAQAPSRPARRREKPFAGPAEVEDTVPLVEVLAMVGPALVLENGTFVRMLEVAPVDLERGDRSVQEGYWMAFAQALRRLRAPAAWQIVASSRPQDIQAYLERWASAEHEWQALAERADDPATRARRLRLARCARETVAFLTALQESLNPMQQRYLVVISYNPFMEFVTKKPKERVLDEANISRALEALEEQVRLARSMFSDVGLPVVELDGPAMCQAIWEHYHHPPTVAGSGHTSSEALGGARLIREMSYEPPSPEAFLAVAGEAEQLADLIAPSLVEEEVSHVRVGEVVARGYQIYDFDSRQPVELGAILSFPGDVTHTLYLTASDPVAIRQRFKQKETELRANAVTNQRRGVVTDFANAAMIGTVEQARAEIEITLQAPFDLHWFALVWANDVASLERHCRQFEATLKLRDIRYWPATRRHLSLLQSTRPLARMTYRVRPRIMSADSLGSFFPFVRREYFTPEGWHFGVHRGNGLLVCLEPFGDGSANASQLVIASPRAGKSVYLKDQVEKALALGHRVFVIDPEREYLRLAADLHAPYIELAAHRSPRRVTIEPDQRDGLVAGLRELVEQYTAVAATRPDQAQLDALVAAYESAMAHAGILADQPATWLRQPPEVAEVLAGLRTDPNASAQEVARVLAYSGSANGGHTLNIMDLNLRAEDPWRSAKESLAAFAEAIVKEGLAASSFNVLAESYEATLRKWGVTEANAATWHRDRMPVLSDLVATLKANPLPQSQELGEVLNQYAYGMYAGLFNHRTNVDVSSAPLVVFGLRSLRENVEDNLASVVTWLVLRLIWNEIVASGDSRQPTHVIVDEAKYVLSYPGAARRLEGMARSFPKYLAALYLATQDMDSLLRSPESSVIANITQIKLFLKQENAEVVRGLGRIFQLSEAEQQDLLRVGKGEGLLAFDNGLRVPIYAAVNPLRLDWLASNSVQQQAVARASGRRSQPVR